MFFRKHMLATVMLFITAVMAAPKKAPPTARMARVNLFSSDGCSGEEFTIDVVGSAEEGCWNTNNVQSMLVMES